MCLGVGSVPSVGHKVIDLHIPFVILDKIIRVSELTERVSRGSPVPVMGGFSGQVRQATIRNEMEVTDPV